MYRMGTKNKKTTQSILENAKNCLRAPDIFLKHEKPR